MGKEHIAAHGTDDHTTVNCVRCDGTTSKGEARLWEGAIICPDCAWSIERVRKDKLPRYTEAAVADLSLVEPPKRLGGFLIVWQVLLGLSAVGHLSAVLMGIMGMAAIPIALALVSPEDSRLSTLLEILFLAWVLGTGVFFIVVANAFLARRHTAPRLMIALFVLHGLHGIGAMFWGITAGYDMLAAVGFWVAAICLAGIIYFASSRRVRETFVG